MPTETAKTLQVVTRDGLFRCSADGQTVFANKGTGLMPCSCGKGIWLFFPEENANFDGPNPFNPVYINAIEVIEAEGSFEVGQGLNLKGGAHKYAGAFLVTRVYSRKAAVGDWPAITVESVGPWDPAFPVYRVRMVSC